MANRFDPRAADRQGLVATTSHLDADLLLEAYRVGVFPWSEDPVRWYSPHPRALFLPDTIRRPKKVGKIMRRHRLTVTADEAFTAVVEACRDAHGEAGEWIGPEFVQAYSELHRRGFAHSIEVWQEKQLVGGLYGVQIGATFAGESMFHTVTNASKVAFAALVDHLAAIGVLFIDAQVLNDHTHSLGAVLVARDDFLALLEMGSQRYARFAQERWPRAPLQDVERAQENR